MNRLCCLYVGLDGFSMSSLILKYLSYNHVESTKHEKKQIPTESHKYFQNLCRIPCIFFKFPVEPVSFNLFRIVTFVTTNYDPNCVHLHNLLLPVINRILNETLAVCIFASDQSVVKTWLYPLNFTIFLFVYGQSVYGISSKCIVIESRWNRCDKIHIKIGNTS